MNYDFQYTNTPDSVILEYYPSTNQIIMHIDIGIHYIAYYNSLGSFIPPAAHYSKKMFKSNCINLYTNLKFLKRHLAKMPNLTVR